MKKERTKASSDPQISMDRHSPFNLPHYPRRVLLSVSGDSFGQRGSRTNTYGSLEGSNRVETPCCVAGEHFLTSGSHEYIRRSISMDSVVHVDISDINGDGEEPNIPLSLRKCKKMILTPYTLLLSVIGWRPWFKESLPRRSRFWSFINFLYPNIVIILMLYHYVYQVLSCQGKYNVHVDIQPPSTMSPAIVLEKQVPLNCTFWGFITGVCNMDRVIAPTINPPDRCYCQHIVPTYIVPSVMHFLAFAYGMLHFRIQECEQLYSLMERVFLQAYSTPGVQNILIRNSRLYLLSACTWLLLQIGLELLYNFTFSQDLRFLGKKNDLGVTVWYSLVSLKFIGMLLVHFVNVAVVLNYCMQCEMLIFYIKGVCLRLHEKSIEMKAAMHEILGVRAFISLLNETMGKMMAFCIVNFVELTIVGTAFLFLNRNYKVDVVTYRAAFPILWFAALILPLVQAARLTRIGSKLRQISFEMRVFGYQTSSQLELDSFVLFVSGATLRAKLFGVSIKPASIILTLGASIFILLTLMVVDLVSVSGYKEI